LTILYIRHPARAEGEGASCRFALVADAGNVMQQGGGALRGLGDLIAQARKVVVLLAASDVSLVHVKVPPLSNAKLKAALPALVEELVLADPEDCVLVAAGADSPDGLRTIAVAQRSWVEAIVKAVLGQGARSVSALPMQLCLPIEPGSASAAVEAEELVLRTGQHEGLGIATNADAATALQTLRAMAGDLPLVVYAPSARVGELQAVAAEAAPGITIETEQWTHLVQGAQTTTIDLAPGLGAAGEPARDWQRWRWPLRFALLALAVNIAGLNIDWLRMKREGEALTQSMSQIFRAAYPKETVILDPVAQMRKNIAAARTSSGQTGGDEFTALAATLAEAMRSAPRQPVVSAVEYANGIITVKLKNESIDPAAVEQAKVLLASRGLALTAMGPGTWQVKLAGGRQ
jgi:general secretion pathway protein L